jgi:glycosyltransferase involved in cell wall biosynthesis
MTSLQPAPIQKPEISAVVTCYFEERTIDEFHSRLSAALKSTGEAYEIIFVNDGSSDGTFEKLKAIFASDPNVITVMDLFQNAGQAAAITAGLEHARGQIILLIDSDLQLDPEELPVLLAEYRKGADIVTGYRKNRKDSLSRIIPSKIANVIMRKIAKHRLRDFGCTFRLFNVKLIRAFEFGPFKPIQVAHVMAKADRVVEVPVAHHPRRYGASGWTFRKLFAYNMDNFVGYSEMPFQALGLISLFASMLFFLRIVLAYVLPFNILKLITSGLILNVVIFGLLATMAVLSAIGEFTIRNFLILRRYPAYIVRECLKK